MTAKLHLVRADLMEDRVNVGTAGDPERTMPGRKQMRVEIVVEVDSDADYAAVTDAVGSVIWTSGKGSS